MTGLVEIPASWYLDDLPPMMFVKKAAVRTSNRGYGVLELTLFCRTVTAGSTRGTWRICGWTNSTTSTVRIPIDTRRDDADGTPGEYDEFVFPVTVHPDVCGHPHGLLMLERYHRPPSHHFILC